MTTNDPRCLFVTSIVRVPSGSLDHGKSIIIQVINVPSYLPPHPSPVGHAASAAYNHSKTRLPNRPQRMHDSDTAPRCSLVSLDRKQKPNGNSERVSCRHATAIESQFTCKARVKWGKINALLSSRARRRCGAPMPICCAHTQIPLPPRPPPFASLREPHRRCRVVSGSNQLLPNKTLARSRR